MKFKLVQNKEDHKEENIDVIYLIKIKWYIQIASHFNMSYFFVRCYRGVLSDM